MRRWVIRVLVSTSLVACSGAYGQSADAIRGQRLYETACIVCHGESVHDRKQRAATSFEEIRRYVQRWSGVVGVPWTAVEIDDVVLYLNEQFYHYPCSTPTCKKDAAWLVRRPPSS